MSPAAPPEAFRHHSSCCAHDCAADPLLRAESLLFRLALRARARGGWDGRARGDAPALWAAELILPVRGGLLLRCAPSLELALAPGHVEGLLDLLLRRLSGDCAEAGGRPWSWRALRTAPAPAGERCQLRLGQERLELWRWT